MQAVFVSAPSPYRNLPYSTQDESSSPSDTATATDDSIKIAYTFANPLAHYTLTQDHNQTSTDLYPKIPGTAYHVGEDQAADKGTGIKAAANGEVVFAGEAPGYGYLVIVEHTLPDHTKVLTIYGHMERIDAQLGPINAGASIGTVGIGNSPNYTNNYGPHLHFAVFLGSYEDFKASDADDIPPGAQATPDLDTSYSGFVDPSGFIARFNSGSDGNDYINGDSSGNELFGGDGDDYISGQDGDDVLHGGVGSDNLDGGFGNDRLIGSGSGDTYHIGLGRGYDVVDDQGGGGRDVIKLYAAGQVTSESQVRVDVYGAADSPDALVTVYATDGITELTHFAIRNISSNTGNIEELQILDAAEHQLFSITNLQALYEEAINSGRHVSEPDPPSPSVGGGGLPDTNDFTWTGSDGDNLFTGTSGDDVAAGLGGVDALGGGAGDDILLGNSGSDVLSGSTGDDLLVDDRVTSDDSLGGDYLDGGAGDDRLVFYGAPENLVDTGIGGSGRDFALVDLRDRGDDWRVLTDGNDLVVRPDDDDLEGATNLEDDIETVAVLFGRGDDRASGGEENDYFDGRQGDDRLDGNDGDDVLLGGDGDDYLLGNAGDWLDGGDGDDQARLDLSDVSENLSFLEDLAQSEGGFTFADGTHVRNVESFTLLETGSGDDQIWMGSGDIDVDTNSGDDFVSTSGHGDESVDGGAGDDRLVVDYNWATEHVRSQYNSDNGVLWIFIGNSEAQNSDHVVAGHVEQFTILGGSDDDLLIGRDGDDVLQGNDGDDSLEGGDGNDTLLGGAGNDDLSIGGGQDWVDGGDGKDLLLVAPDQDLRFLYDSYQAASATGYTLNEGTHVQNVESLYMTMAAQQGISALLSGYGHNVIYISGTQNDIAVNFDWSPSSITSTYDSSQWTAATSSDYNLGNLELLTLGSGNSSASIHIAGSTFNDQLLGAAGNDEIDGRAGADIMAGGKGDDTYYVDSPGDTVSEVAGEGTDTVYSQISFSLGGSDIENLVLAGSAASSATGNALANTLVGNEARNILNGGAGSDLLDGNLGADVLKGGKGNDTFVVDNAADATVELADEGIDTVLCQINWKLSQNIENLTLAGSAINGIGNDQNNVLNGNALANILQGLAGNDRLDGGGGADRLVGGLGNDTFMVDDAGDKVIEANNQGIDTIETGLTYALTGLYVENLTLTGTGNVNAGGNGFNNVLTGNSGNNALNGGRNADTMRGGAGNDLYFVDNAGDVVVEKANEGKDAVNASITYSLGNNVETLVLTGYQAINGTGNAVDNTLTGNGNVNVLNGGGGKDVLIGQGGNDILTGGNGADQFRFYAAGAANGLDHITDFLPGTDRLVFTAADYGFARGHILTAAELHTGAAVGSNGQFLYNTVNHTLYWDADGAGGVAAVGVAVFDNGATLKASDFAFL